MRRLLPLVPVVVGAVLAGLLWAHDATWSIVVGIAVAIVAVGIGVASARGRFGALLAFAAVVALSIGTAAAASGLWLSAFGTEATVTVSHVRAYDGGKGVGRAEDYTLRLADGSEVAGPLHQFAPGTYRVGDRLDVVHDPTGLVRFPVVAGDRSPADDAVGGLVAVVAALTVLVSVRLRRPLPPKPGGPHRADVRVADLQHRLADEQPDGPGAGAR